MKVGDLVVCPTCVDPDETGFIVEPERDDGRIGVMWTDVTPSGHICFEPVDILKVVNHD